MGSVFLQNEYGCELTFFASLARHLHFLTDCLHDIGKMSKASSKRTATESPKIGKNTKIKTEGMEHFSHMIAGFESKAESPIIGKTEANLSFPILSITPTIPYHVLC